MLCPQAGFKSLRAYTRCCNGGSEDSSEHNQQDADNVSPFVSHLFGYLGVEIFSTRFEHFTVVAQLLKRFHVTGRPL